MKYIGDYKLNETIHLPFNTNGTDGSSLTFTGDVSGLLLYKDASTTHRNSWDGITLDKNFAGFSGCHLISIDTSNNSVAGFYAINSDYEVMCSGFIVDSTLVNSFLGSFSLENRNDYGDLRKIKGEETPLNNLYQSASTIYPGFVGAGATTTVFKADNITEATADHFNGRVIIFTSGDLKYQATDISDYAAVDGYGQFTVTALTEAPASGTPFVIV